MLALSTATTVIAAGTTGYACLKISKMQMLFSHPSITGSFFNFIHENDIYLKTLLFNLMY